MTYKRICLTFIILTLIFSCQNNSNINSCADAKSAFVNNIKKAKNKDDTLKLIKEADKLIIEHPGCVGLYIERGDLLISVNDLHEGKDDFYKAAFLDTGAVYPLYQLAFIYQQEKKYDSSIYFLSKVLAKKTYGRAVIDFNKLEGVDDSKSIGRYDVDYIEIVYQLATCYYYKHDLGIALTYFNYCIKENYRIGKSFLYRGSVYLELNKRNEACEDFKAAKMYGDGYAEYYLKRYCIEIL
jgi:tetratricopeptide (TPR) repeat protein